ncbi:unnamed protein product [Vitrella brassicaformis CCMP3155]|uniref:Uncharacterized protein n=2 Tax=Vitrella brassicaformis TaxID=1169539 RepID=A0A0G4FBY6_VITBC|nr:unnamed protein product [Vitrella brassicaformis CCMP3155]|eukprot:CEM10760.1 unnamed protein product [Vitrella brassicaformis CCMP3155]
MTGIDRDEEPPESESNIPTAACNAEEALRQSAFAQISSLSVYARLQRTSGAIDDATWQRFAHQLDDLRRDMLLMHGHDDNAQNDGDNDNGATMVDNGVSTSICEPMPEPYGSQQLPTRRVVKLPSNKTALGMGMISTQTDLHSVESSRVEVGWVQWLMMMFLHPKHFENLTPALEDVVDFMVHGTPLETWWVRIAGLSFYPHDSRLVRQIWPIMIHLILWHGAICNGVVFFFSAIDPMWCDRNYDSDLCEGTDLLLLFMFWSISLAVAVAYTVLRVQWIYRGDAFLHALDFVRSECNEANVLHRLKKDVRAKFAWTVVFTFLFWSYFFYIGVIDRALVLSDRHKKYFAIFPGMHNAPQWLLELNGYLLEICGTLFEPFIGMTVAAQTGIICVIHRSSFNVLMYHMMKRDRHMQMHARAQEYSSRPPMAMALTVPQLIEMHRSLDGMLNRSSLILQAPITAMGALYFVSFLSCLFLILFREPSSNGLDVFFIVLGIFFTVGLSTYWILSDTAKVTAKCARLAEIASFASRHYYLCGGTENRPSLPTPASSHAPTHAIVRDLTLSKAVADSIMLAAATPRSSEAPSRQATADLSITFPTNGSTVAAPEHSRTNIKRSFFVLRPSVARLMRAWRRLRKVKSAEPRKIEIQSRSRRAGEEDLESGVLGDIPVRDDSCALSYTAFVRESDAGLGGVCDGMGMGGGGGVYNVGRPGVKPASSGCDIMHEAMEQLLLVQYFRASNSAWRVYGVEMTSSLLGRILYTVAALVAVGLQRALSL